MALATNKNLENIYPDPLIYEGKKVHYIDVLEAIGTLNLDWLEYILDDQANYLEEPCWVFLKKIKLIFDELINAGDDHLNYYIGEMNRRKEPKENSNYTLYRFIANNSKYYFDLVFETNGDYLENLMEELNCTCQGTEIFVSIQLRVSFRFIEGWSDKNESFF